MVLRQQPTGEWTEADFRLLEAYQTLQDETCGKCGQFIWICRSSHSDLQFAVETTTCNATNALDSWKQAREKRNKKKPPPEGEMPFARPYVLKYDESGKAYQSFDPSDFPTREDYYKELAEREQSRKR